MAKKTAKDKVMDALSKVLDPELGLPVTDLGLIYNVEVKEKKATITMTLTTIGCPLFDILEEDIRKYMKDVKEVEKVRLELVFDPPWSPEMMSEEAKAELGFN